MHVRQYKTLLSLGNYEVEQDNIPPVHVSDSHPQTTGFGCGEGHFYCVINISSTTQAHENDYIPIFTKLWPEMDKYSAV